MKTCFCRSFVLVAFLLLGLYLYLFFDMTETKRLSSLTEILAIQKHEMSFNEKIIQEQQEKLEVRRKLLDTCIDTFTHETRLEHGDPFHEKLLIYCAKNANSHTAFGNAMEGLFVSIVLARFSSRRLVVCWPEFSNLFHSDTFSLKDCPVDLPSFNFSEISGNTSMLDFVASSTTEGDVVVVKSGIYETLEPHNHVKNFLSWCWEKEKEKISRSVIVQFITGAFRSNFVPKRALKQKIVEIHKVIIFYGNGLEKLSNAVESHDRLRKFLQRQLPELSLSSIGFVAESKQNIKIFAEFNRSSWTIEGQKDEVGELWVEWFALYRSHLLLVINPSVFSQSVVWFLSGKSVVI
eukprot:TRINITY_DN7405_c0_g1_i2.p1 TRINITY_DN7405_c0_g1~~TRINITY_DN7405_c0_g1_i2.p1  ORF type:complete len:350 (-),score=45.82 TRINITY_DN7405_c0_g1_i2:62-1111(-)